MDAGKKFPAGRPPHEFQKFVAVDHRQNAKAVSGQHAEHADDGALAEKNAGDLQVRRAERLEHPDFARFLDDKGDLRAQDAERGDQHDEKQQVKHDVFLDNQRPENRRIILHPGGDG